MDESLRQSTASSRLNYCNAFAQVSDLTVKFGNTRKTKWCLKVLVASRGLNVSLQY